MTTATPEQEQKPFSVEDLTDPMQKMQFQTLSKFVTDRNALVGKANAASGDRQTLTEQIRDNSQDPEIVRLREVIAEAEMALYEKVKPEVDKIVSDSQAGLEEIEKEIKEIDQALKPGMTYYKKLYPDGSHEHFPSQARLTGATVRSGSSTRRIRGYNVIVTIDGDTKEFENFASAAKHLDIDTGDLQTAFFSKAGTETLKDVPNVVTLTVNFQETDEDGNSVDKEAFVKAYRVDAEGTGETVTPQPEATQEPVEVTDDDEPTPSEDDLSNAL